MRRLLASFIAAATLAVITSGTVLASAPLYQMLPAAACNQGTAAARPTSGNPIVPMFMATAPVGCMTMPALHP